MKIKRFTIFYSIFVLLMIQTCAQHLNVTREELQKLGADCYPRDSCVEKRASDSLKVHSCHCGSKCKMYDTCCLDSKHRGKRPSVTLDFSCVPTYRYSPDYLFMATKCRSSADSYLKQMCLADGEVLNDPMLLVPVTNTKTRVTYRNLYCAACNGDVDLDYVVAWEIKLKSHTRNISVADIHNLKFLRDYGTWASAIDKTHLQFSVEIPRKIARWTTACSSGSIISTCARNWNDAAIRAKCRSYMAIVMVTDERKKVRSFRNVHCATCNFAERPQCSVTFPSGSGAGGGGTPFSFALLLDVNRSDGDIVGQVQRCKSTELYDPFKKICRPIVCIIPGTHLKDGKCVKV